MGLRDNLFASAPGRLGSVGQRTGRAGVEVDPPWSRRPSTPTCCGRALTCGACVEAVPGRHRARRHHHRHAPLRGPDGVPVPHRGRPHAPQHREPGRSVGLGASKRTEWTDGPRLRGPGHHRDHPRRHRVPLLGGLRRRPRRAGPQGAPRPPPACCTGPGSPSGSSGPGSRCTGDPARRLGNEYLYQEHGPKANIETLDEAGVKKVIATCPHCFNSLASEYPALGGNFEVIHHCQLLDHLVDRRASSPRRRVRGQGHLSRPLLSRPPQPGVRRAPFGPRLHPRGRPRSR